MLADKPKQHIFVFPLPIFSEGLTFNREEAVANYRTSIQLRGNQVRMLGRDQVVRDLK
jgi:hypothetical protein